MDREEYNLCFLNGKKHIVLAKTLADNNDFGTAISFLILGLEELIKYLVIQTAVADKTLFSDKEINNIFSSHKEKHKIIIELLRATKLEFGENFVLSVFNKMMKIPLTPELQEVQANRFKEFGTMVGLTERHLSTEEIDSFILWLQTKADELKNKGLYVNRESKSTHLSNSKLISPSDINKIEYDLILKFTDSLLKQASFSHILDISDDDFIKILNSDFKENNEC